MEMKKAKRPRRKVQNKYVYAYDPLIKRRVVHLVVDKVAVSLITGHVFKLPKKLLMEGKP